MAWKKIAISCEQGPCPTFYVDEVTGDVRVQGNRTTPHEEIPSHEEMVEIPAADWRNLIAQINGGQTAP